MRIWHKSAVAVLTATTVPVAVNRLDQPKQAVHVVVRTSRKEQLILMAVGRRPAAEFDSPKLVNHNRLSGGVFNHAHELPVFRTEATDCAREVDIVADQQGAAQRSKILRSHRESPGLVERFTL